MATHEAALVELIRSLRNGPTATSGVSLPTIHITSFDGGTSP